MKKDSPQFDVAVIGGGPAGMMAAGRAANLGAKVVLLEKNKSLGRKLLLTGKGRCNITQTKDNKQEFIEKLGKGGRFLFPSLNAFDPEGMIEFLEQNNLETKVERGGRVFPVSDKSFDVVETLRKFLTKNNVEIQTECKVKSFETKNGKIECINLKKTKIFAKNFIVCTGGLSYSQTGSTGDGYAWTKKIGHKIVTPKPALVSIKTHEKWVKDAQGLSLKNVELSVFQRGKKKFSRFGQMLFTDAGLSGPIVIDLSKKIGELLEKEKVFVEIDLKPALDFQKLDQKLLREFEQSPKKDFKNYLPEILPKKIIPVILKLSEIDPSTKLHSISKKQRKVIIQLLKNLKLEVAALDNIERAVITAGGINLKEIDSKTMRSKIASNLFLAGEVIDLDGPTGGYNLQICWSTGFAAGTWAAKN